MFATSFVKVVPNGAFWTACFNPGNSVVVVDIVLPVRWLGDVLEEVDLELDILRTADGGVQVRDRETFERVRELRAMPGNIAAQAEATCERLRSLVDLGAEPFGAVGRAWPVRFLAEAGTKRL